MTVAWNPSDKGTVTLSNSNYTASTSGGNNEVRATLSHSTGKWYLEYNNVNFFGGGGGALAFANSTEPLTNNSFGSPGYFGVSSSGGSFGDMGFLSMGSSPTGHVTGIAVDLTNLLIWFQYDGTGNWNGSGTADPATGTGGVSLSGFGSPGAVFPYFWGQNSANATLNSGDGNQAFTGTVPTGFTAWAGTLSPTGTWASTEAADMFAGVGYVGAFGKVGDLDAKGTPDTFAAVGFVASVGALFSTENPDIFSAFLRQPITGALASTEAKDSFAAIGLGRGVNGQWASTENPDIFAAVTTHPISGALVAIEAADRFLAVGVGANQARRRRTFFVT